MIRYALALALFLTCTAGAAAPEKEAGPAPPPTGAGHWLIGENEIASIPARIAFPRVAGVLTAQRHQEFSHPGEGIDNALQYFSSDQAIVGTLYLYYPGLPHAGIAAFATDNAIRLNAEGPVVGGVSRVVPAGGKDKLAIRADYSGYRGMASSAAFLKAGRWLIKIRVSGPEGRKAEVEAAMQAMLGGIRFGPASPPYPAAPLTIRDCPADGVSDAEVLPDPPKVELAAHGLLATFDGGGIEARNAKGKRNDLPSRVPPKFCLSARLDTKAGRIPILRGEKGPPRSIDGRTMLLAILGDSGSAIEVVHAENLGGYVLLYHEIGGTTVLGRFGAVPSDRQMAEIINNPGLGPGRPRVPVILRPGKGPAMHLPAPGPEDQAAAPATTA